ncbi:MAG: PKD domain-containing protein [Thermoplasmatota archaeon]
MDSRVLILVLMLLGAPMLGMFSGTADEIFEEKSSPVHWASSYSFDFGSREFVQNSYIGVSNRTMYTPQTGYGMLEEAQEFLVTSRMVGEDPSPFVLSRSWVYEEYGNNMTIDGIRSQEKVSFRVDLENGTYRLILWLGDLEKGIYSMDASMNDELLLERAEAFHPVHRSMYFKWNPNPRFPDLEYINYGMAVPYYLEVNVTQGHMIINVSGNDELYDNLLEEELAREPAYSYSVWMSTGTRKYSAGTGPWRYIGGPFTNASLLGIDIRPFPDFPIEGDPGSYMADRDIDASEVLNGLSALNSENLEGAFQHWKNAMEDELSGRNRLARSQLGLILAGLLPLDHEIEILPQVEPDIAGNIELRGDPALVELWTWANLANRGLKFEFERILYDPENPKNHFIEANKAFVLLDMIPEFSPLYPKMQLWAARCLMNLDPHRWTSASGTAMDMMENIRPFHPHNPYIRMYMDTTREEPPTWEIPTHVISTTGVHDNWTLHDYNEGFGKAPEWASLMHEELGWLYDVTDWWVDNRMQENGYLGGGWTDDVEMIGLFGFDALISEGADDKSLEGAGRFVDGMLESGQVNMELGYSEAFADVEHTAELTGDSLPMMIAVDFGNPKWVEFSMKTAVLMRDLWMGENAKGWYQFRSNYLSATRIGTGGQAEDSWINFRAVLPALWAWWYSNDPEIEKLLVDWANCWVNAALSEEKEKPYGIIPAGIGWPDGEIGGHDSPNWYTAAHPAGSVNYDWGPQSYKSYIVTLLETAYEATRNPTFLEPLRLEAQIAQEYIDSPDPRAEPGSRKWAGMILGQGAINTYRSMLDKYQLPGGSPSSTLWRPQTVIDSCEDGYHYIRKCYPLMTTEASATDRALFIGVANPFLIFTGGSIGGALLAPQYTYTGLGRDFAAIVRDGNPRNANISMYGFFEGVRKAGIVPWALEPGGDYILRTGFDPEGDGIVKEYYQFVNFTYETRGQVVNFDLHGGKETMITIVRSSEGSGVRDRLPDPAFGNEEVAMDKEEGTVTVKLHNIGSEDAEKIDIYLYEDLDGGLRQIGGALDVSIRAPAGLEPSIEEVDLRVWKEPWIGEVVIRIDPDDELMEICESNNELRGYWDLEGINLSEMDLPLEINGTVPITYADEDIPTGEVLDLSLYIWDPDGTELEFSINPTHYSFPWLAEWNGSMVSFYPSSRYGDNFSGTLVFKGGARGPGKDRIWNTDDDEGIDFDVILVVLPANDPPHLKGIKVGDKLIHPVNGSFPVFQVLEDTIWRGELIVQDIDGDIVNVSLLEEQEIEGLELNGTNLSVPGKDWYFSDSIVAIRLDDGNGSVIDMEIKFKLIDVFDPPVWLGVVPLNGRLIPAVNKTVVLDIYQGEELVLELVAEPVDTVEFEIVSGHEDFILRGDVLSIATGQEHVDIGTLEVLLRAIGEGDEYADLLLRVLVIDVNDVPTAPGIIVGPGPFVVGSPIYFSSEGSTDIDMVFLEYKWDFGEGADYRWAVGLEMEHIYYYTGTYLVTLYVRDDKGAVNSSSVSIEVKNAEPVDDDDDDDIDDDGGKDKEKKLDPLIIVLILLAILILLAVVVLAFILTGRRKGEASSIVLTEESEEPMALIDILEEGQTPPGPLEEDLKDEE